MPTVATQPTLRSTQAVGAALLHHFARERFLDAGLDESLIREAETIEHVDRLATSLLLQDDENDAQELGRNEESRRDSSHNDYHNHTSNNNDDTVYHSFNRDHQEQTTFASATSGPERLAPITVRYGRELRKIAEEFEKSRERQFIREEAGKVALNSVTREAFTQLLEELFRGGVTREKIVVIFLFATDVALRAASLAQELVVKLMGWSFSYIINTVCRLVHELGGWEKLLFYQLPSLLISCCTILAILALGFHLNRSIKWSS